MSAEMIGWTVFGVGVVALLVLDLGVFNKRAHVPSARESLGFTLFYVAMALLFGAWVWFSRGAQSGQEYLTGYLLEESLSLDNIFIMSLIFGYLRIPPEYQHRVLFLGILGAIVFRGLLIALGGALVAHFEWVLYLFAAFILWTGAKMLWGHFSNRAEEHNMEENPLLRFLRRHFRLTEGLHGQKFVVRLPDEKGRQVLWLTPLCVALVLVECADVVFAFDSVPAIFAVTKDPFIVYTSNIFAILGLRSLYFTLAAVLAKFRYLKVSLALVLVFIGCKVLAAPLLGIEKIPAAVSLGVTVAILAGGVLASVGRPEVN